MLFVVQGFIDSFFLLHVTSVSDIVFVGLCNFYCVSATIRSENMSEQAQGDLLQTQSQEDEQARGETRYRLNCHEERCNRKRIHTHSLKDRNCEMQEGYARDAQVKPYLEQQNLGELITAEHKVSIKTCESGNNHRYWS